MALLNTVSLWSGVNGLSDLIFEKTVSDCSVHGLANPSEIAGSEVSPSEVATLSGVGMFSVGSEG